MLRGKGAEEADAVRLNESDSENRNIRVDPGHGDNSTDVFGLKSESDVKDKLQKEGALSRNEVDSSILT